MRLTLLIAGLLCCGMVNAEIPLRDFAKHAEFDTVKISPTGTYIALTAPTGDQTGLAVMRLSDRTITAATRLKNNGHIMDFWWVGPERLVYSVAAKSGHLEEPQAVRTLIGMNADGNRKKVIGGGFVAMINPLPNDPEHAVIAVRGIDSIRSVWVNVFSGKYSKTISAPDDGWTSFLADANGITRYAMRADDDNQNHTYWRTDDKSRWRKETTKELAGKQITPIHISNDGKAAFLSSNEAGDKNCLVRRDLVAGGSRKVLACNDAADLRDVIFSFDGNEAIAVSYAAGKPELQMLDTAHPDRALLETIVRSFAANGDLAVPVSHTEDGSKWVLLAYSDRNPGDFYLFDRATKKAEYLVSRHSWIDPAKMAERRPVSYKSRDGHTLHAYLTLPRGGEVGNLPLVVHPHGGPFWILDSWGWEADPQAMASRGYAVLQVNFRGSGGFGKQHLESGKRAWGTTMINDITDGARWAIENRIADPKRVCIYGGSYGGYAAVMGAIREPGLYRCAVTYVGVYDLSKINWESFAAGTGRYRNFVKDFIGDSAVIKAQSPSTQVGGLKAPVLIVHGEEDMIVPISHATDLREALDERKHPYEWLVKPKEGHGFYRVENRVEFYEKLIAFLDKHIGSAPAAAVPAAPPSPPPPQ